MKKPNIFWHMILWGFLSGSILGQIYLFVSIIVLTSGNIAVFAYLYLFCVLGNCFGAIPGTVLGILDVGAIWYILRRAAGEDISVVERTIYRTVFLMTLVIGFIMLLPFFSVLDIIPAILYILPPFIAAIAATFAAHRYLLRLERFYEQAGYKKEKRKGKPKHEMSGLLDNDDAEEYKFAGTEDYLTQKR